MAKLRLASLLALLILGLLVLTVSAAGRTGRAGFGSCTVVAPMSADGVPTIWPTSRVCP